MDGAGPHVEGNRTDVERQGRDAAQVHLSVVVLAAGAGSRFSPQPGAKLLADLEGRPILEHVLAAVRSFGPAVTVVVLGHGAQEVERRIRWHGELRIVNRTPERGLASSIQAGVCALASLPTALDGTFIVLGDQPLLAPEVMRTLAAAAASEGSGGRPLLVPRYAGDPGPQNPVLLMQPAWGWVLELEGDRGLSSLAASRLNAVLEIPVDGVMPDVDAPADLARLRARDPLG